MEAHLKPPNIVPMDCMIYDSHDRQQVRNKIATGQRKDKMAKIPRNFFKNNSRDTNADIYM